MTLRDDGYHDLVTVFHAVDLVDELTIGPAARHSVQTIGFDGVPTGAKNLAGIAARLLAKRTNAGGPVAIEINKQIPVAGGMAGGSADAAAALVGCASLWELDIGRDQLSQYAAELGSDVPFALTGGTAVGTGRGERLSPVLARTPLHWVLALAESGLSTPAVFAELDRLRAAGNPPQVDGVQDMLTALASGDPAAGRRGDGQRPAGRGHLAAAHAAPDAAGRTGRGCAGRGGFRIGTHGGPALRRPDVRRSGCR